MQNNILGEAIYFHKAKSSTLQSILDFLEDLFLCLAKGKSSRSRTWHQHVVPYEDVWAVRREGNKRITSKYRKQNTAIHKAKTIEKKRKAVVITHRADGTIRDRVQYD